MEKIKKVFVDSDSEELTQILDLTYTSLEIRKICLNTQNRGYFFLKRFCDVFLSGIALVVLSPLLVILALLVKCTSKGPILFNDERVGLYGKIIHVHKFRSMRIDAETNPEKYLSKEQMEQWKTERKVNNDPRITKLGKFMRKTSLDELPQLINIFCGSMSFVGPRPVSEWELQVYYKKFISEILRAKPGLTGYWQVYGRSDCTYESGQRVPMELEYLKKRNFKFDVKLVFKTIPAVLLHRGAK